MHLLEGGGVCGGYGGMITDGKSVVCPHFILFAVRFHVVPSFGVII